MTLISTVSEDNLRAAHQLLLERDTVMQQMTALAIARELLDSKRKESITDIIPFTSAGLPSIKDRQHRLIMRENALKVLQEFLQQEIVQRILIDLDSQTPFSLIRVMELLVTALNAEVHRINEGMVGLGVDVNNIATRQRANELREKLRLNIRTGHSTHDSKSQPDSTS